MKRYFFAISFFLLLSSFIVTDSTKERQKTYAFETGERLYFKAHYGWFHIANGEIKISDQMHQFKEQECFKVDAKAKTTGIVGWVVSVEDHWGSFVEASQLKPQLVYENIKEGDYRRTERAEFDYDEGHIVYKRAGKDGIFEEPTYIETSDGLRDAWGSYLHLRSTDMEQLQDGDTIRLNSFFEGKIYDFRILFKGTEVLKTKVGKLDTYKLVPIMPDNKIFDGENSITVWISRDKNKIPVKIVADMFIGKTRMNLVGYEGLKYDLQFE